MDLTQLVVDTGQFINRAVQYTEESLGQVQKTELEPDIDVLLSRADATKTWTDQIISQTEVLLQPSPGARLENRLYEHLDWNAPSRPSAHEVLGDQMTQAGMELGTNTPYGKALVRCGETQKQLGEANRKFVQSSSIHFLNPLRSYSEVQYKAIQDERRTLLNKRLDLDIAKTRLRKAHEAEQESRNLNTNHLVDDYVSQVSYMFSFLRVKWLKMWAQEISQAEMELRICESLFSRQCSSTKQLLNGLSNIHINHMQSLTDFVDAQAYYFSQCNQHAQELHKELASIPAVLCSNNWQSEFTQATNHTANEPVRLNQITPILHRLPDFDQESWTVNLLPSTVNATNDSAAITKPDQQINNNNNNNNNNSSTDTQAVVHAACVSNLDQTTQPLAPNGMTELPATSQVLILSGATSRTKGAGDGAGDGAPATPPPHQSQAAPEKAATTETSSESAPIDGDDIPTLSANQDVVN